MELKEFIAHGAEKAGGLTELGKLLGLRQQEMTSAKGHRRPIPLDAAVRLADYIGADLRAVIAANELVTEKKEEKREFWRPFAEHARAASLATILLVVTSFVTSTPAEAAPVLENATDILCIMLSLWLMSQLEQIELNRLWRQIAKMVECAFTSFIAPLKLRTTKI